MEKRPVGEERPVGKKTRERDGKEGKGREGGESPVRTVICTGVGHQFQRMTAVYNHREEVGNRPTIHCVIW